MSDEITTVRVEREVIDEKLLVALDDGAKVAILASEEDLDTIIHCINRTCDANPDNRNTNGLPGWIKQKQLLEDLQELRKQAFGE